MSSPKVLFPQPRIKTRHLSRGGKQGCGVLAFAFTSGVLVVVEAVAAAAAVLWASKLVGFNTWRRPLYPWYQSWGLLLVGAVQNQNSKQQER